MENVKLIQQQIEKIYGKTVTGMSYYRLVWSEDLWEIRKGDFEKRTEAGIYLGTSYNVVQKVKKYGYLKDKYILEFYAPQLQEIVKKQGELIESDGYESLFVFHNNKGEYLKPVWWAVQLIIRRHQEIQSHVERRTEAMDKADDQKALEAETLVFLDYLEQESSDLANKFRYQEAVLIHKES